MKAAKKTSQQTLDDINAETTVDQDLNSIDTNGKTTILIPDTTDKYKIGWMKPYTTHSIAKIRVASEPPEDATGMELMNHSAKYWKMQYKVASYIILNNIWKIKFFHFIYWRWLAMVKQYTHAQLQWIIILGKKKMDVQSTLLNVLLMDMIVETTMMTTKLKVGQSLQKHLSAPDLPLEKSILGQSLL